MKQAAFTNTAKSVCKRFTEDLSTIRYQTDTKWNHFYLFQMKLIAPSPGEYSSNTLESNPGGGGRKITTPKSLFLPISVIQYPSPLSDESWKWCGGERIFPVFLTVAGNPKHILKPSTFLHSKCFTSQSSSTSLATLQLQHTWPPWHYPGDKFCIQAVKMPSSRRGREAFGMLFLF